MQDTGWRTVTDLVFGWTATSLHVRRCGAQCFLRVAGLDGSASTNTKFYVNKTGFVPLPGIQGQVATSASPALVRQVTSYNTTYVDIPTRLTSDPGFAGMLTWFTDEAWPQTLPGVPYP